MSIFLRECDITNPKREDFPYCLPLFNKGLNIKFNNSVTFIVGDNGSGKSTLLENIAHCIGFNILGGNRNHNYRTALKDNVALSDNTKLIWSTKTSNGFFMRAESFLDFAEYLDEMTGGNTSYLGAYGGKSLNHQSHGEAFLSLFNNKFSKGIFILDEPEAALSPQRQLSLLRIIHDLTQKNDAQFIIATHSPMLMAFPNATLFVIEDGEMRKEDYKNTMHFQLTKRFLDSPEQYLRRLFNDDEAL